ncbi:3,4-dihydroxy-2-butanone-4-phosphate synthase [Tenacibaculum larymnensis]|uniref:3,4-dihydroxy-2-butanone 4-phosphate synthase n=1 Tax=Tenacibaculum larymnensis TaxID=2878201 RepID=A0A9X4ILC7_9FLAO|nr:3,4-dihydroxy-2-butanone-4-phosphate synthase [Tenacibaculum larymnensis]MDE1206499.1 3,4-dihydroxy-2-butanone-4-phosphate synthase [Tenacibaculum larymnensis]
MVIADLDKLKIFGNNSQERLERALKNLQNGNGIILVDDEDRENEGDLIFSAHNMTINQMALMIRKCSGIVCLCMTNEKADFLNLPYMIKENTSNFQTPFTISIEAKEGVTTGVSAKDRLKTIQVACSENTKSSDLAKPGHIFPLRANNNGVLTRKGHTEGSVDLMKLAGLKPEAVLCELMNDDGTMAKNDSILHFAKEHNLIILSIQDIILYRKFVRDYK